MPTMWSPSSRAALMRRAIRPVGMETDVALRCVRFSPGAEASRVSTLAFATLMQHCGGPCFPVASGPLPLLAPGSLRAAGC
eukprot:14877118-Alexandrium_andersonii.AAC.1